MLLLTSKKRVKTSTHLYKRACLSILRINKIWQDISAIYIRIFLHPFAQIRKLIKKIKMKKLTMFVLAAVICTSAVNAQDTKTTTSSTTTKTSSTMKHKMGGAHKMNKDCIMMKEDKLVVMKGGNTSDMDQSMTLTNGATVNTDGTVTMKDGTSKQLKNGDCVFMNGKMMKSGSMHKKAGTTKKTTTTETTTQ